MANRSSAPSRVALALLALVIALQCSLFAFAASQRQDFDIDEIYSYVIANSANADRISHADWLLGNWVSGSDFDELVAVQPGEELDFAAAYENTATDAHPPLYYWVLHAVCALSPGTFTAWTGIALNIICFAVGQVFLFLIGRELMKSHWLALVPVVLYGFSGFALGAVEFIRMYALLGMLAMIFTWLSIRIAERGVSVRTLIPAIAVLYLGGMTQYYFLIYAFWLALILGVRLLIKRRTREAVTYGLSTIATVALILISFPAAISQVTGSSTNNIGNEITHSMFDIALWGEKTVSLARDAVLGLSISPFVAKATMVFALVALVAAAAWALLHRGESANVRSASTHPMSVSPTWIALWLTAAFALAFLTISKVGGEYVYLRYIWFIMPIAFLAWTYAIRQLVCTQAAKGVLVAACLAFSLANAGLVIMRGDDSYTYSSTAQTISEVAAYSSDPLVVIIKNEGTAVLTSNFTTIKKFDDVYISTLDTVTENNVIADCLAENGSCVVYISHPSGWTDGYDVNMVLSELDQSIDNLTYSPISEQGFGDYYLLKTSTS